ncbi:hypothetical protein ACQPYK_22495 [Streptosporangium sp. CA-135522]|uniref:P-type ATPase n=1 Tax=Streptosporangium sp. CA-135522 TaxID=3240072 RepID=UPI003D8A60E7
MLTGESVPARPHEGMAVFADTFVIEGEAVAVVTATAAARPVGQGVCGRAPSPCLRCPALNGAGCRRRRVGTPGRTTGLRVGQRAKVLFTSGRSPL